MAFVTQAMSSDVAHKRKRANKMHNQRLKKLNHIIAKRIYRIGSQAKPQARTSNPSFWVHRQGKLTPEGVDGCIVIEHALVGGLYVCIYNMVRSSSPDWLACAHHGVCVCVALFY